MLEHPDLVQAQSMIGFASAAFQQALLPGIALPQRAGTACPLPPALVVRILYVPALISTRRYSSLLTACAMLFHPQAALAQQCGFGTGNYGIHMEFHSRTSGPHFLILKYSSMTSNVPSASGVSTPLQVSWQPVFSQAHVSSLAGCLRPGISFTPAGSFAQPWMPGVLGIVLTHAFPAGHSSQSADPLSGESLEKGKGRCRGPGRHDTVAGLVMLLHLADPASIIYARPCPCPLAC